MPINSDYHNFIHSDNRDKLSGNIFRGACGERMGRHKFRDIGFAVACPNQLGFRPLSKEAPRPGALLAFLYQKVARIGSIKSLLHHLLFNRSKFTMKRIILRWDGQFLVLALTFRYVAGVS